jgi:two-component sensor histidine kinase
MAMHHQDLLLHSARQLTASLDLAEVLTRITAGARALLSADGCAVYMLDTDGRTLRPVSAIEPPYDDAILASPLDVKHSLTGQAVTARQVIIFNDAGTNPCGADIAGTPDNPEERLLAAPFIIEDQVLGALSLSRDTIDFTEEDRKLAEALAIYAAIALKSAQTHAALQSEVEERVRAEVALRELTELLESRVDERTADLEGVNEALATSLREKEVLLQEIHHRVKNNLQVISSLLSLQADHVSDPQAHMILRESQHRVRSMALIHEKLYRSACLAQVDFGDYVHDLAAFLFRSFRSSSQGITLHVDAEPIGLPVDIAMPCGLILNELVSNALKHAFPDDLSGAVTVMLGTTQDRRVNMVVADTGVGFAPGVDFRHTETLGLQLVAMLVEQIDGTFEVDSTAGTRCTIGFGLPTDAPDSG